MTASARDQLHRVIEQLPDERVGVAAELLAALASHDERVGHWRASLSRSQVAEIATSLRQQYAAEAGSPTTIDDWLDSADDAQPVG